MSRIIDRPGKETYAGQNPSSGMPVPLVSVIVLNYNGAAWLEKCLSSLRSQTIFDLLEIIVADNASPDRSDVLAARLMAAWKNGRVIQHGANLGFCEGNNRAATKARGHYLFFLNNDTWMAPDCIERLVETVLVERAQAAQPLIHDYIDVTSVCPTAEGFDIFGMLSVRSPGTTVRPIFVPAGCCYLIKRDVFEKVGGFDPLFFMYVDEYDLSWRLWISGGKAVLAPTARLHHRGAANVNPEGGEKIVELRTSESKRYYTNRNGLLLLLKNAEHVLLLLAIAQLLVLTVEALFSLLVIRRWTFVRRAYVEAVLDCWRARGHVLRERRRIRQFRVRGDFKMLSFLRAPLNRWHEFRSVLRHGLPKVS